MAFNPRDVFPGAQPIKQIDIATLVEALDPSQEVPVVYSFGGGAPTSLSVNGREVLNAELTGGISNVPSTGAAGRLFVEYRPYGWDPQSPEYSGS